MLPLDLVDSTARSFQHQSLQNRSGAADCVLEPDVLYKIETGEARTVKEVHRQIKDAAIAKAMANPTRSETWDCTVVTGNARCLNLDLFEGQRCDVIIAYPPWPYDNPKDHNPRMGGYTYQPMTLDEIKAMPLQALAADDAILFLWGTWPKLPQVIETMRAWGFEHVTGFPWVNQICHTNIMSRLIWITRYTIIRFPLR